MRRNRWGTLDLDAVAAANIGVVVENRPMLGATVIPERDRIPAPAEAALKFRRFDVVKQKLQQVLAF